MSRDRAVAAYGVARLFDTLAALAALAALVTASCAPQVKSGTAESTPVSTEVPATPPSWSSCFPTTTLNLGAGRMAPGCAGLLDLLERAPPTDSFDHVIIRDGSPEDLRRLSFLRDVRWLEIHDGEVGILAPLAGLAELERVTLEGFDLSDLAVLASLPQLRQVELGPTDYLEHRSKVLCPAAPLPMIDPGLGPLEPMYLHRTLPACASLARLLASLPTLPQLEDLTVSGTAGRKKANPVDLVAVAKFPNLRRLEIHPHNGWLSLAGIERSQIVELSLVRASLLSLASVQARRPPIVRLRLYGLCQTPSSAMAIMTDGDDAPWVCTRMHLRRRWELSAWLEQLTELTHLDLRLTAVGDLTFLTALQNLQFLGLTGLNVDLSPLLKPPRPCFVDLSHQSGPDLDDKCDNRAYSGVSVLDVRNAYQHCPSRCANSCGVLYTCPIDPDAHYR